jgi:hypothetical protein
VPDYDQTLPPRRRDTDRINWVRVSKAVAFSLPAWGPALWWVVMTLLTVHSTWLSMQAQLAVIDEVKTKYEAAKLEMRVSNLEGMTEELIATNSEQRLDYLEQWQCRLGWNPPASRKEDRPCHENEDGIGE